MTYLSMTQKPQKILKFFKRGLPFKRGCFLPSSVQPPWQVSDGVADIPCLRGEHGALVGSSWARRGLVVAELVVVEGDLL